MEDWSRRLVAEHQVSVDDLIWPIFVQDGNNQRTAVESMPGVDRLSIDLAVEAAADAADLGIPVIALFPQTDPDLKTPDGAEATNPDNLVCQTVRAIKSQVPNIGVLCDVALDPYTDHGQDGVIINDEICVVAAVGYVGVVVVTHRHGWSAVHLNHIGRVTGDE